MLPTGPPAMNEHFGQVHSGDDERGNEPKKSDLMQSYHLLSDAYQRSHLHRRSLSRRVARRW